MMCFLLKFFSSIFNFCDWLWVELENKEIAAFPMLQIKSELNLQCLFGPDLNFTTPMN